MADINEQIHIKKTVLVVYNDRDLNYDGVIKGLNKWFPEVDFKHIDSFSNLDNPDQYLNLLIYLQPSISGRVTTGEGLDNQRLADITSKFGLFKGRYDYPVVVIAVIYGLNPLVFTKNEYMNLVLVHKGSGLLNCGINTETKIKLYRMISDDLTFFSSSSSCNYEDNDDVSF